MNKKIAMLVAVGCVASLAATNYDLLGRNGSKKNTPMVYRNVDRVKMNINKPLMRNPSGLRGITALAGAYNNKGLAFGPRGTALPFSLRRYYSDGTSLSAMYSTLSGPNPTDGYIADANECFKRVNIVQNASVNMEYFYEPTYTYGYYLTEEEFNFGNTQSFWDVEYQKARRGDASWIDDYNFYSQCQECGDVGLYMDVDAYPVRLDPSKHTEYAKYSSSDYMSPNNIKEMLSSRTYSILQATTKNTIPFVMNRLPENPVGKIPQVYIGLHNRPNDPDVNHEAATFYSEQAKVLDNYIYNNRTVEVVAAGDYWIRNNDAQLNAQGHAANAITVGAVDAASRKITSSTSTRSRYCKAGMGNCPDGSSPDAVNGSAKPEIYNYTHFHMVDKKRTYETYFTSQLYVYEPFYDGTETAATYTANIVAALLRANPFYRWHPEVVKALLISSGDASISSQYPHQETPATTKIPSYWSVVNNRFHNQNFHDSRYWIGYWPTLSTHIVGMKSELRFSVKRPSCVNNFSSAIAWLSSGNDIARFGQIPQNFDLYVYDNSTDDVNNININNFRARSKSKTNAFEKVAFTSNAQYLTFRIVLQDELQESDNYGQAILGFDLTSPDACYW